MKKLFLTATLSAVLIGFTGGAFAQSNAMEESNDANSEALSQGSGVTTSDQQEKQEEGAGQQGKASGHSDAANQSINAIESETDGTTSIENSEELDELSAEGQSDAAGDSLESQ